MYKLNKKFTKKTPYVLMALTIFIWGLTWPIGKVVANDYRYYIFTVAVLRFTFALPFLFVIVLLFEKNISLPLKQHKMVILLGILQIFLYNFFYLTGLVFTSSSDAALVIAINPALTAIFASQVYDDEKLSKQLLLGLICSFLGVGIVFIFSANTTVENRILGNMLIFFGAIVWALYTTFSRPVYQKISPIKFQFYATLYGWGFLVIFALFEQPWNINFKVVSFGGIIYLGIFAAAIANSMFSYGVKELGPTKTSIFVNFVPVIGIFFSIVLLKEEFIFWHIIAFIFIVVGATIINRIK